MRFSEVGVVRWNHDAKEAVEKQQIEVEILIDKKSKKFRRQAGDPLMKLMDRVKLCMVNSPNQKHHLANKKQKLDATTQAERKIKVQTEQETNIIIKKLNKSEQEPHQPRTTESQTKTESDPTQESSPRITYTNPNKPTQPDESNSSEKVTYTNPNFQQKSTSLSKIQIPDETPLKNVDSDSPKLDLFSRIQKSNKPFSTKLNQLKIAVEIYSSENSDTETGAQNDGAHKNPTKRTVKIQERNQSSDSDVSKQSISDDLIPRVLTTAASPTKKAHVSDPTSFPTSIPTSIPTSNLTPTETAVITSVSHNKPYCRSKNDSSEHTTDTNSELYPRLFNLSTSKPIPTDLPLHKAFPLDMLKSLQVVIQISVTESIKLVLNPPTITKLELNQQTPKIGVPLFPLIDLQYSTHEMFTFKWLRLPSTVGTAQTSGSGKKNKNKRKNEEVDVKVEVEAEKTQNIVQVASGMSYTPTHDDLGFKISLAVQLAKPFQNIYTIPINSNNGTVTKNTTINNPILTNLENPGKELRIPYKIRHEQTKIRAKAPDSFRFCTYNILADCYANTDFTLKKMAPYLNKEFINMADHRLPLIMDEVSGYNADIICLQECEKSVFDKNLVPRFGLDGLEGRLALKDKAKEGVAIFYDKERFKFIRQQLTWPKILMLQSSHPQTISNILGYNLGGPGKGVNCPPEVINFYFNGFNRMKNDAIPFLNSLIGPPSVIQLTVLQDLYLTVKTGRKVFLIVANTHLFFHSQHTHTRLVQTKVMHDMVVAAEAGLKDFYKDCVVLKVVAGDLNTKPKNAVVRFLEGGSVASDDIEWFSMGRDQYLPGFGNLKPGFKLKSAIDFEKVKYTTYVNNFTDVLDHIFYDPEMVELTKYVDQPSHEDITANVGLPSRVIPSDHLAQIVDFKWRLDNLSDK